jgi:hypothetical protein
MATTANEDLQTRIALLEGALRRYSRRFTVAMTVLVVLVISLGVLALTPVGPWLQARLPWSVNLKVESVSAKRFIVVDGDKQRAVLGLDPGVSRYESGFVVTKPTPYPSGLAALWFYDELDPKYGYRLLVGLREDAPQKGSNGEPDYPRYQPVIRGELWPSATNEQYETHWP